MWRNKILDFNAHITISVPGGLADEEDSLCEQIEAVPGVKGVAPFLQSLVFIQKRNGQVETPMIRGIDPAREPRVSRIPQSLIAGEFSVADGSVVIGSDLAELGDDPPRVGLAVWQLAVEELLADAADDFSAERFDRHMAINLRAPLLIAQALAAQGVEGSLVNVVDQRVWRLTPDFFTYTLSKSALWTATQTMAQAFAPRLRVNAVAPGPTLPNAHEGEAGFAREVAALPLRRGPSPEEIADAVVFLARAASVTGQMIAVDGGQQRGPA